ncbi:flagellar protein FlaG [Caloranaerobacter azorensis DSM 13643]|uniref:Flagellar protein FlaG n=1 Tax=Caloranaerobacter azorensis DSM 13643 TaxID=1121264 RepID=A0A1M5WAL7_9FIRM|nr:flagellar protein FlaG [Caloranaerobacter azorensis]SHH84535.1 flagellar protein FlaG [Caloranaerobacter azorensis DSM 13643]
MKIDSAVTTPSIQKVQPVLTIEKLEKQSVNNSEMNVETSSTDEQKNVNEEELIRAIETVNKSVKIYDRRLEFSVHEKTKEIIVKVIDTNTDEVIREIPPEKILDMVAKLWEMVGILVDEKV